MYEPKTLTLEEVCVLVVGDGCWGRGKTLDAALEKAKNPKLYIAYFCTEEARVDEYGYRPIEFHRHKAAKSKGKK